MWAVYESHDAAKALDRAPPTVIEKYELWKAVVTQSGVIGLRAIRGFHDEALAGSWKGHRSSRLSLQWRVLYRVQATNVYVVRVTPHDYRR